MRSAIKLFFILCAIIIILNLFLNQSSADLYMSISGKVLYENTSQGVPNVTLTLINEAIHRTEKTDQNGNFRFQMMTADHYRFFLLDLLNSLPDGFVVDSGLPDFLELKNGKNIVGIVISIRSGATISGKIFAEDGSTPLSGIKVWHYLHYAGYHDLLLEPFWMETQTDGSYTINEITSAYPLEIIGVDCPGYNYQSFSVEGLQPGEERADVDYQCRPETNVFVLGTVVDESTLTPVSGAKIVIDERQGPPQYPTGGFDVTSSTGQFLIKGILHGEYNIRIEKIGFDHFAQTYVSISGDVTDLGILKMRPSLPVKRTDNMTSAGCTRTPTPTPTPRCVCRYEPLGIGCGEDPELFTLVLAECLVNGRFYSTCSCQAIVFSSWPYCEGMNWPPCWTRTATPTRTRTPTRTPTGSQTITATPTINLSETTTPSPGGSETPLPTVIQTPTPGDTQTPGETVNPSQTATAIQTGTPQFSPTPTAGTSPLPTSTAWPTGTHIPTPTRIPTATRTPTKSQTPTLTPTITPTPTPTPQIWVNIESTDIVSDTIVVTRIAPDETIGSFTLDLVAFEDDSVFNIETIDNIGPGTTTSSFKIDDMTPWQYVVYDLVIASWTVDECRYTATKIYYMHVLGPYEHTCYITAKMSGCPGPTEFFPYTLGLGDCTHVYPPWPDPKCSFWVEGTGTTTWLDKIFDPDFGQNGSGIDLEGRIFTTEYYCKKYATFNGKRALRYTGFPCGKCLEEVIKDQDVAIWNKHEDLHCGDRVCIYKKGVVKTVKDTGSLKGKETQLDHYVGSYDCGNCPPPYGAEMPIVIKLFD